MLVRVFVSPSSRHVGRARAYRSGGNKWNWRAPPRVVASIGVAVAQTQKNIYTFTGPRSLLYSYRGDAVTTRIFYGCAQTKAVVKPTLVIVWCMYGGEHYKAIKTVLFTIRLSSGVIGFCASRMSNHNWCKRNEFRYQKPTDVSLIVYVFVGAIIT